MLFCAVLRSLERDASSKANMVFPRLCYDVPRAKIRSKRSTPLGRGCVKSLVCGAIWTPSCAKDCGYQVLSTKCTLCQECDDSELHRLWECSSCQDQRLEIAEQSDINQALAAEGPVEQLLYSRGLFEHPGDKHPRPANAGASDMKWADDDRMDADFQG
eukprot:5978697-Pyramimonas_sp.AAC.1